MRKRRPSPPSFFLSLFLFFDPNYREQCYNNSHYKGQVHASSLFVQSLSDLTRDWSIRGCNTSNTRNGVSSGYPNTEKRVQNTTRSGVFLTRFGVWIADEILSRVFDISSQSKQKLRSKRRSKIVKIYAN